MGDSLHIVVFPWLAFGHMLPFLELSKSLAQRGHRISFISTPRNIQRLPKPPLEISDHIDLIAFDLPKLEGLPESAEATSDLPYESVEYLKLAFDRLDKPFGNFIKQANPKPDWIIHDFAHHWIPPIATEVGVPTILLSISMAGSSVFFGPSSDTSRTTPEQLTVAPPWIPFPSNLCFRLHEARTLFEYSFKPNLSGFSDADRFAIVFAGCKAIAVRSCNEMEPNWLNLLPKIVQKTILPVGLLPPQAVDDNEGAEIMRWLDKQNSRTVVYIAFGSEATLSPEREHVLALGLELAKMPFVWVLRTPRNLPDGFEDRTRDYGIVAKSWVPQMKILAHESVGVFLMHSGWSSIIESLQFGHPLVLLPIFGDQGLIARVVIEKGIAVEIERDEEDGNFTKEAVAEALRLVIVEEEGESIRSRARELKEVFGDKDRQEKYVDDFVRYLKNPEPKTIFA